MKSKVSTIMKTVLLTVAVMSLLLVSIPTVSATTLKYRQTIFFMARDYPNPDPRHVHDDADPSDNKWWYWAGTINDISTGQIVAYSYFGGAEGGFFVGKVAHFREHVYIVFADSSGNPNPDSWILGAHDGIWNIGKVHGNQGYYRTVGRITDASADKASFIGCRWEEEGVTDGTATMGVGVGFCWIKAP